MAEIATTQPSISLPKWIDEVANELLDKAPEGRVLLQWIEQEAWNRGDHLAAHVCPVLRQRGHDIDRLPRLEQDFFCQLDVQRRAVALNDVEREHPLLGAENVAGRKRLTDLARRGPAVEQDPKFDRVLPRLRQAEIVLRLVVVADSVRPARKRQPVAVGLDQGVAHSSREWRPNRPRQREGIADLEDASGTYTGEMKEEIDLPVA